MTDQLAPSPYDAVVLGAGTAGLACAVVAAQAGARVLVVEKDYRIGGTLHYTTAQLSAAGTRLQQERSISDSPALHYADVMRISRGTARSDLVRVATDHAAATVDWLQDLGVAFTEDSPAIHYGHEPYEIPRSYTCVDAGSSILRALEGLLREEQERGRIDLWLDSTAIDIRVQGTEFHEVSVLRRNGAEVAVRADSLVIATGGFASNPEMFLELEGVPLVSAANPAATGDGIALARQSGAALQGQGHYLPTFGGPPVAGNAFRSDLEARQIFSSQVKPSGIFVNKGGRRWVAEDDPSVDVLEHALVRQADMTFWHVLDAEMLRTATGMRAPLRGRTLEEIDSIANRHPGVSSADTLEGLAEAAGFDPAPFVETVARYNEAVDTGADDEFGRTVREGRLDRAPYYAFRNHGITVITFTGLDVDEEFAVRTESGETFANMFAIGEILGAAAFSGNSFCSGMSITPALTAGRLLGQRIGAERRQATPTAGGPLP